MTRNEAIKFLHNQIKTADPEKLTSIVCGCFSPRCSNNCPLKDKFSSDCKKIIFEENSENN